MNAPLTPVLDTPEIAQHRREIKSRPRDARSHAMLGVALLRAGRLEEGVPALRRAIALSPALASLHAVLAPALHQLGQHEAAIDSYRRALRGAAGDADLHKGLADVLHDAGQYAAAADSMARAAALAPQLPTLQLDLAVIMFGQERYAEAAAAFRRALELLPYNDDARLDLARTLVRVGEHQEATACAEAVLARHPDRVDATYVLANCLREQDRKHEIADVYRRALAHHPDDAVLLGELGVCQQQLGQLEDALATLERSMALAAPDQNVLRAAGYCHFELGNWEAAQACWQRGMELDPTPASHSSLLFLLSHSLNDPAVLTAQHRRFGELWETPLLDGRRPHPNAADPARPIRIGFVSPDLHSHAMAQFIVPVFALLQRSTALVSHVYYNNRIEDETTRMLRAMVPHWRAIVDLDDEAAEQLIRDDGIDILIDLAGHSALNRLTLFARKPAPLQATWMGYTGTTGLQAMDYYLTDQFLVPEGRYDDQFTEQIVRMPVGAPFLPHAASPAVSPLPALRNGHITFGSFHRANKISRAVVAQWSQLLRAIPDARMLLGGLNGNGASMLRWFDEEGIGRERLILRQRTHMADYLGQHADVDVCLSPLPYSGGTTICHAMWMGVPTLAIVGPTNPSHAAAACLAHLGLSSFLAYEEDEFVKLGVFLSENLATLAALRASMRERFVSSAFGHPGVVAAGLEVALRKMWGLWCSGRAAEPIRVRMAELGPDPQAATAVGEPGA